MDNEQDRLMELFNEARAKRSGQEREAYLADACRDDVALRRRVEALLWAHAQAGDFLRPPSDESLEGEGPGTVIGRYKLCERLGEGGFGAVYVAEQEEPVHRRVALKLIKLGMDTRQVIARFEAERQALAMMEHPNIAKVLDAGGTGTGRPYFVMELVQGQQITDYCDENRLSTEQRLELFMQVCHAVQHAHQKGIIHRDLKPSNILVTLQDGLPVPKVIDFGIAKATGGQMLTDKTLYTGVDQFLGTPVYTSPEQAQAVGGDIDTRSDIYNLGVLLYELLTGRTPFDHKPVVEVGLDEIRRVIREQEPARPSTRLTALTAEEQTTVAKRRHTNPPELIHLVRGDLDWIVMKCLEKDRARRYETANGLAEDVLRHVRDEPVVARPPSRFYRFQKLARRNKVTFVAGALVAGALVLGLGLSTWLFLRERAAHARAQAEAKKSEQVAQFLKDMLQGVGPSAAQGRDTAMLKEILDKTAERVGKDLKGQPEVEAELRSTIGGVYDALGQYDKAEAMHRLALTLRRELWGDLNTNVADSLDSLGWELLLQDKVDAAEPLFQEALTIRTNLLGPENVNVATSLYHLGHVGLFQAWSDAEQFFRQSLAIRKKLLGNENKEVAETLSGLSAALWQAGDPKQAEIAAREALAIRAGLAPEERSCAETAIAQMRLGRALLSQKKFTEAEQVDRQAVTLFRSLLMTEHYYLAHALNALAEVLISEEKLVEAESVAREAVVTSRRALGGQHFCTAYCLINLGIILHKTGRLAEAETAFRESLDMGHQLGTLKSGSATINAACTCGLLAEVMQKQGKRSEAEALVRAEVETVRKSSVPGSRTFALGVLADWLRDQGRPAEAEPLYSEALSNSVGIWPNAPAKWQRLVNELAEALYSQGRTAEIEPVVTGLLKPTSPSQLAEICLLRAQANLALRHGLWKDAASALSKLLALDPLEVWEHLQLAMALAEIGDVEQYRAHCRDILKRFAEADDLDKVVMAATACLLVPGACPDPETVSTMTKRVVAMDTGSSFRSFRELENGLAEYRHGDYDGAIASMRQVLGQPMSGVSSLSSVERGVAAGAVLAMAHYQLGQGEQAREALVVALNRSQNKIPQLGPDRPDYDWVNCLIARILLREAKGLLGGGPTSSSSTEPANPPKDFDRR